MENSLLFAQSTLSEELNVTQSPDISLPSILLAILAPTLFILLAYLIIKMSSK